MAEHGLKQLTALGHDAPKVVEIGACRMVERFDVALASLAMRRGREGDVEKAAKAVGLPLPGPSRAEAGTSYSAFWVTPEMWMVEAPFDTHEDIAAHLKAVFSEAASITEQTDAWVRLDISAPDPVPLFERLSNLDLAKAPIGFASRTVIEHLGCYLIKQTDGEITLYGPRASAKSLLHALKVAAQAVI